MSRQDQHGSRHSKEATPVPNPEFLRQLIELGIPEELARKALILTNNQSLEMASSLALDLAEDGEDVSRERFKMVFILNSHVKLTSSGQASKVGIASLHLYHEVLATEGGMIKIGAWRQDGEKVEVYKADITIIHEIENQLVARNITRIYLPEERPDNYTILGFFASEDVATLLTKQLKEF